MAQLTPEEKRALDWQHDQRRRLAFEQEMQAKLKAPSERAIQTKKNWEPVRRQYG